MPCNLKFTLRAFMNFLNADEQKETRIAVDRRGLHKTGESLIPTKSSLMLMSLLSKAGNSMKLLKLPKCVRLKFGNAQTLRGTLFLDTYVWTAECFSVSFRFMCIANYWALNLPVYDFMLIIPFHATALKA